MEGSERQLGNTPPDHCTTQLLGQGQSSSRASCLHMKAKFWECFWHFFFKSWYRIDGVVPVLDSCNVFGFLCLMSLLLGCSDYSSWHGGRELRSPPTKNTFPLRPARVWLYGGWGHRVASLLFLKCVDAFDGLFWDLNHQYICICRGRPPGLKTVDLVWDLDHEMLYKTQIFQLPGDEKQWLISKAALSQHIPKSFEGQSQPMHRIRSWRADESSGLSLLVYQASMKLLNHCPSAAPLSPLPFLSSSVFHPDEEKRVQIPGFMVERLVHSGMHTGSKGETNLPTSLTLSVKIGQHFLRAFQKRSFTEVLWTIPWRILFLSAR